MAISLFLQENFLLPKLGGIFLKPVKLEAMLETIARNKAFQGQSECLRAPSAIVGILTSPNVGVHPKSRDWRMDRDLYSIGAVKSPQEWGLHHSPRQLQGLTTFSMEKFLLFSRLKVGSTTSILG